MAHGKSASEQFPIGKRSISNNETLAPKSLRKDGKYLKEHSIEDLSRVLHYDLAEAAKTKEGREFLTKAGM